MKYFISSSLGKILPLSLWTKCYTGHHIMTRIHIEMMIILHHEFILKQTIWKWGKLCTEKNIFFMFHTMTFSKCIPRILHINEISVFSVLVAGGLFYLQIVWGRWVRLALLFICHIMKTFKVSVWIKSMAQEATPDHAFMWISNVDSYTAIQCISWNIHTPLSYYFAWVWKFCWWIDIIR